MADDAEVEAMSVIVQQLEPLDRAACSRVLAWARERYTQLHVADGDLDGFSRFVEAITAAATEIGGVTPMEIIRFVQAVKASDA